MRKNLILEWTFANISISYLLIICLSAFASTDVEINSITTPSMVNIGEWQWNQIIGKWEFKEIHYNLDFQEYLKGVVPNEMYSSFNSNALKAQAVIARSYAIRNKEIHAIAKNILIYDPDGINYQIYYDPGGYNLCNTTHCQVWEDAINEYPDSTNNAVNETENKVLKYNSELINATYFSSSRNHYTKNSEDVWPNYYSYSRETITPEDTSIGIGGHGVGMSQYGAEFLANQGFGYEDILKHYYGPVPPYVKRIIVTQDNRIKKYDAEWKNDDYHTNPTRTPEFHTNVPFNTDSDATIEVYFSEEVLTGTNCGEIKIYIGNEEASIFDKIIRNSPTILSKKITASQLAKIGSCFHRIKIIAKHKYAQEWQLDSHPETFAYQSIELNNFNNFVGYEPGEDSIHEIYVSGPGSCIRVATTGDDITGDGSATNPYRTIQRGIDVSVNGDTVIVNDGIYTGLGNKNLDFNGKAITVRSSNGAVSTIIDCENSGSGFYFHSGETSNSVVDGFTIINGSSIQFGGYRLGGGIYCKDSSPTIVNNIIKKNVASVGANGYGVSGGGIYCSNSSLVIKNNKIIDNIASTTNGTAFGGGIYCEFSSPIIENNIINGNIAAGSCGMWSGGNGGGGGIFCSDSSPLIRNNVISNNSAVSCSDWASNGGGILCRSSSPKIINNTIAGNSAKYGGGIYCEYSSSPIILNTIIWGNSSGIEADACYTSFIYSDIQGGYPGEGNINSDPFFVDATNNDYRLKSSSPCIGAGIMTSDVLTTDINGIPRPNPTNSQPDIGAYENLLGQEIFKQATSYLPQNYQQGLGTVNNTNLGTPHQNIFINSLIQILKTILDWEGSEVKLEVYKPDGTLYGQWQSSTPPIIVDIPDAGAGGWNFVVTAIDIPYLDYPAALIVGEEASIGQPVIETQPATNITDNSAILNAEIINNGETSIDKRKFTWGTTASCSDECVSDISDECPAGIIVNGNTFNYVLTNLEPNQIYYFQSWAHNSIGWDHGNTLVFKTKPLMRSYVVDSLGDNDDGLGYTAGNGKNTLRKCIRLANTNIGPDTINFSVSGTINFDPSLPNITDNETIIDASSQWSGTYPDGSPGVTINGGDLNHGIVINGASDCVISGLFLTNNYMGVEICGGATDNIIGGTTAGKRNIISGNKFNGIYITGSGTNNNQVKGNYIGTNADGTVAMANGNNGIAIESEAQNNIIGGTTESERNIVSGNGGNGIGIDHSTLNQVKGNYIGINVYGNAKLGNTYDGVAIGAGGQNNIIGGTTTGERNVISGNGNSGVMIAGVDVNNNQVKGNYIGTDASGNAALGNTSHGIHIYAGAKNNLIGGTTENAGNKVAHNGQTGITTELNSNTISHNSIYDNTDLGIVVYGISDPGGMCSLSGLNLNVSGDGAGPNATVEIFKADNATSGEGKIYLGSLIADEGGNFAGVIDVTGKDVSANDAIVINTTHTNGNTSKFRLIYSTIDIPLYIGWNGMSCPGEPAIIDWNTIKTGNPNIALIVEYDTAQKKFVTATNIEFGKSYFIGVANNTQITMKYLPKDSLSLPAKAGWNPMGSLSSNILTGNVSSEPLGKISLIVYYDHSTKKFAVASAIIPGVGYMAGCMDDCILSMDCSSLAPPIQSFETEPLWESILSVQTQSDHQELTFGMNEYALDGIDLYDRPIPPFPEILGEVNAGWVMENSAFDLLEQSFVKDNPEANWNLSVELLENGKISWRNLPKTYDFALCYDNHIVNMHIERSISLPTGKYELPILVKPKIDIPDKTSLLASYPNPCNPETWIPYELSNNAKVKIMIYSSSGNLVRSLDLGYKPAGRYIERSKAAYWDGRNESGEKVSSGIYFYTLVTPEFSQIRKLLIIR